MNRPTINEEQAYVAGQRAARREVSEITNAYVEGAAAAVADLPVHPAAHPTETGPVFFSGDLVFQTSLKRPDMAATVRGILNGVSMSMICMGLALAGAYVYGSSREVACGSDPNLCAQPSAVPAVAKETRIVVK